MKILEVDGLCKAYPAFSLKNVSFSMEAGCIMGFIGRNGAGKTTTLKSLLNFVHPDSGSVRFFGKSFGGHEAEIKRELGFVSGGVSFYMNRRLSAITGVTRRFYPNWDEAAYRRSLERFSLDESKSPKELSAGMKMKYQLALALSHGARLLILDEPTSGLDPVSRDDLLDLLLTLCEEDGVSVLFSTHIITDLEKCAKYITYIKDGEILASCAREDFRGSYRLVRGAAGEWSDGLGPLFIGYRRHLDGFEGLIRAEDAGRFSPAAVFPADLESIMIYTEKEAAK